MKPVQSLPTDDDSSVGQTVEVKRSTAIRHLTEMAEVATDQLRFRSSEIGWPLEELWVSGQLLEPIDELEHGSVVLILDLQPGELPWLAVHPKAEWVGEQLRLGKRPISWHNRSIAWPAWTYRDRRVARFWSATHGLDEAVIDGLRFGHPLNVVEPSSDELDAQLRLELIASRAHLRSILDSYWDHDWRRDHRSGTSPEDQLWRAATAVTEIESALADTAH
jgi:hypothetical protein